MLVRVGTFGEEVKKRKTDGNKKGEGQKKRESPLPGGKISQKSHRTVAIKKRGREFLGRKNIKAGAEEGSTK